MRVSTLVVSHLSHMTTTTAPTTKPKRRRARRRKATVMNQQQPIKVELPEIKDEFKPSPRVEHVRPDVQLINREAYWNDFQNRMKIHDYEVTEAINDLKVAIEWTNHLAKRVVNKVKDVAP